MKKLALACVALLFAASSFAAKGLSGDLLHGIVNGDYNSKKPQAIQSMLDGEYYTQLSADGKTITKYSYKTGKAVQVLFDAGKTKGAKVKSIEGYFFSPTDKLMLVYNNSEKLFRRSFVANYYIFDPERNQMEALTDSAGKQRDPVFSPNGRNIVFYRGHDLFMKKMDYDTESAVTKDGCDTVFNGVADWLYEEEFGITNLIAWSPDSKQIAFVRLNESQVGTYSFDVFGGYPFQSSNDLYPTSTTIRYPKTGTSNPKATLNIFDVYYKSIKRVDLTQDTDIYIPRIKWTNDLEKLAAFVLNRSQNRLEMYSVNSKSLIPTLLLTDEDKAYVDYENIDYVQFLNDNRFSFASEKDGYRHLYLYSPNGILEKQLTSGKFDVTKFYGYDSIKKLFYFQAAEKTPMGREIYSVDPKGKQSEITDDKGTSNASFSNSYAYFVKDNSTANTPDVYTVCTASGKKERVLEENKDLAKQIEALPQKEFLTIKNADGTELNAWMIKPTGFDANKKYPVIMYQYSGPNSQEVLDEYSFGLEQEFAAKGFIVVCVDGRGTGARGVEFRKCTYQHLGVMEAKDQVAAAKYLATLPYVDGNKIGIWGWSYGGFTTLMSMSTGEKVFAAGVAVAPATDFKFYDTAYTERYMGRPEENIGGYDGSSPMALAAKLEGKLLLVHGTADDNCHVQNTLEYADRLVQADKQFDMQIYTNKNHSIKGGNTRYHLYTRITNFFLDNLK